jgi:hypothetical protein
VVVRAIQENGSFKAASRTQETERAPDETAPYETIQSLYGRLSSQTCFSGYFSCCAPPRDQSRENTRCGLYCGIGSTATAQHAPHSLLGLLAAEAQ